MKKKKIIVPIIIATLAILGIFIYFYITKDSETEFSISETLWIQKNKDTVVSVSLPTSLPVFSDEGDGVFFDYIEQFEEEVEIDLNEVTSSADSDYSFKYKIDMGEGNGDTIFYTDNYVALSKKELDNKSLSYIKIQKAGALATDKEALKYYLEGYNITYYNNETELLKALNNNSISLIYAPQTLFLNESVKGTLKIAHYFNDIEVNYVLESGEQKELNSIFTKIFNTWTKKSDSYYKNLFNIYVDANSLDEITKTNFKSKRYTYGYISNMPYDSEEQYTLLGINAKYINTFTNIAGIEFSYEEYSSIENLKSAFEDGEIDVMFSNFNIKDLNEYSTINSHINSNYVVLKNIQDDKYIDGLKGLKNLIVATVKNTALSDAIGNYATVVEDNKAKDTVEDAAKADTYIAIDYSMYEYYKTSYLEEYIIMYSGELDSSYNFIVKNSIQNDTFITLFNQLINNSNTEKINLNSVNNNKLEIASDTSDALKYLVYSVIVLFIVAIGLRIAVIVLKDSKKKKVIQKDEKMRYFDMMTSLKNRNYLNQNMGNWNETTIYPQTLVIVDLNNIKYINDTHGHEAGDKVIVAAANILINTQSESSDIIRTNGNEFLIYLVGYNEKQVVGYIRKLYKEMKTLPYNYGAEIGYSTITDDIKTIDDAINEATIDMRKNKKID